MTIKEQILTCFVGRVTEVEYFHDGFMVHCGRFVFTFAIVKDEFTGGCYDLIKNKSCQFNTIQDIKDLLIDLDRLCYISEGLF